MGTNSRQTPARQPRQWAAEVDIAMRQLTLMTSNGHQGVFVRRVPPIVDDQGAATGDANAQGQGLCSGHPYSTHLTCRETEAQKLAMGKSGRG